MANLIKVLGTPGGQQVNTPLPVTVPVYQGAASTIKAGMLVYTDGAHAGYWKAAVDTATTTELINGAIAVSDSTETVSVEGTVEVIFAPVMLISIKAKTPANLTAAMKGIAYILDVTGGSYTLDQGTATNGIFNLLDFDNTTDGNCTALLTTHWRG